MIMSKGGVKIERYFDKDLGFGDIIATDGDEVLVRFDANPWYPQWMPARA
jgi:hypothetical protein